MALFPTQSSVIHCAGQVESANDRVLASDIESVPMEVKPALRRQKPASVMV